MKTNNLNCQASTLIVPSIFNITNRSSLIVKEIKLINTAHSNKDCRELINRQTFLLKETKINILMRLIYKIVDLFRKIFGKHSLLQIYDSKYSDLKKSVKALTYYQDKIAERGGDFGEFVKKMQGQVLELEGLLALFKSEVAENNVVALKELETNIKEGQYDDTSFGALPAKLQRMIKLMVNAAHGKDLADETFAVHAIVDNISILTKIKNGEGINLLKQLVVLFENKTAAHKQHALLLQFSETNPDTSHFGEEVKKDLERVLKKEISLVDCVNNFKKNTLEKQQKILEKLCLAYLKPSTFDVSTDSLMVRNKEGIKKPVRVTMVGVECKGVLKQGGLAEAIHGIATGVLRENPDNKVRLILPKINRLEQKIIDKLEKSEHTVRNPSTGKVHEVWRTFVDGIECLLIDDEDSFTLPEGQTIYSGETAVTMDRFANFSNLAAELAYQLKDETDVVHLHDWHVAGVALRWKNIYHEQWKEKKLPPVVFTFHNLCVGSGVYNYHEMDKSLKDLGLLDNHVNLFVEALKASDYITTVSKKYGIEVQEDLDNTKSDKFSEEWKIRSEILKVAREGRLRGIVNGLDTMKWSTKNNEQLLKWYDPITNNPVDLTFDSDNAFEKKRLAKAQLCQWIKKYRPNVQLDENKPFVTYIGRYDYNQKGLDLLETAVETTIKNGGQIVLMGSQEDEHAAKVLDRIEKKYKGKGVLVIRDSQDDKGQWKIQQGSDGVPGINSIVRASSDFIFMPSRYEPCGLVQMEGWIFGSIAIGSDTGGLSDTIIQGTPDFNGYKFDRSNPRHANANCIAVMEKALKEWNNIDEDGKRALTKRIIDQVEGYGWNAPNEKGSIAQQYLTVYKEGNAYRRSRKGIQAVNISNLLLNAKPFVKRKSGVVTRAIASVAETLGLHRLHDKLIANDDKALIKQRKKYSRIAKKAGADSIELMSMYNRLPKMQQLLTDSPQKVFEESSAYLTRGAHYAEGGATFRVGLSKARKVSLRLVSESEENMQEIPMVNNNGQWECHCPWVKPGQKYQFIIDGKVKIDPYGRAAVPSSDVKKPHYSIVVGKEFEWTDAQWMQKRKRDMHNPAPMNIYEMHPTRWKRKGDKPLNYRELAHELSKYCKEMHFTHVELMGILEHPDERSWGYQVTGFFSPNHRLGSPEDFKYLVDHLHKEGIGVIMDWVPAHFAKDEDGLSDFDGGSSMYEPSSLKMLFSVRKMFYPWGTNFFDFRNAEVRKLLLSSAMYWAKEMHIDAFRVDAVSNILWEEDGKAGKAFLKDLNRVVHAHDPSIKMIAEDYSGNENLLKHSYRKKGLGFDMMWNTGSTKEIEKFFASGPDKRKSAFPHIRNAFFSYQGRAGVLTVSHDEVGNGRKPLIHQTPSLNEEERFANMRLRHSLLMCRPGKKLNFMGNEFGMEQTMETLFKSADGVVNWQEAEKKRNLELRQMVKDLNRFYAETRAFYEKDESSSDVLSDVVDNNMAGTDATLTLSYRRTGSDHKQYTSLHNFSLTEAKRVYVKLSHAHRIKLEEEFNSDALKYGGAGRLNVAFDQVDSKGYYVTIPPSATVVINESMADV